MDAYEKKARELLDAECIVDAGEKGKAGVEAMIVYRAAVRAIIAALTPPDGYVLAPAKPTPKMVDATWDHHIDREGGIESQNTRNKRIWCAMLAARPEVP